MYKPYVYKNCSCYIQIDNDLQLIKITIVDNITLGYVVHTTIKNTENPIDFCIDQINRYKKG